MTSQPFTRDPEFAERLKHLPQWTLAMCDGCSVPTPLRVLFPIETPAERAACCEHDRWYYYGGSRFMRRCADALLRYDLRRAGMTRTRAYLYWLAVRIFAAPAWTGNKTRWAWGDAPHRYCYTPDRRR